jgi:hypothetical protein
MVAETFFDLLDVGTSNARVLYNEQLRVRAEEQGIAYKALNIVEFKMQLVDDLVGMSLFDGSRVSEVDEHKCIPMFEHDVPIAHLCPEALQEPGSNVQYVAFLCVLWEVVSSETIVSVKLTKRKNGGRWY